MPVSDYAPIFEEAGREWNVDPNLLRAMAQQESGGNPRAVSKAHAQGVMQIIPSTQQALGVADPTDPAQSIFGAAKYMRQLLDQFKDQKNPTAMAVAAYNAGPDRVNDFIAGKGALPNETQAYLPAIQANYAKLSAPPRNAGAPQPAAPPSPPQEAVPSDGDFLKSVAPQSAAPVPTDEDFLKGVGAAPAAPPAPEPAQRFAVGSEYGDLGAQPWAQGQQPAPGTVAPAATIAQNVGHAVADTYANTPNPLMSPKLQDAIETAGPVGRYITSPLLQAGGMVLRGANALGAGMAAGIGETANQLGVPALGRDLNMMAQVAPMAHFGTGVPGIPEEATQSPLQIAARNHTDRLAAPLPEAFRDNPGNITASLPAGETLPNPAAGPAPPVLMTAPPEMAAGPKSVGAAASRDMAAPGTFGISPKEEQAYRSTAEGQKLIEPQQPGIPDNNVYVPGVTPNASEVEQTVNSARELKALNVKYPEVSQDAKETAAANNDARQQHFAQVAGSDVDLMNARDARAAQAEQDLSAAWANKTDADIQPVLDVAQQIKASPDGRRPLVQKVIDSVVDQLKNPDGSPVTDPEQLYGVRKHIDDLISPEGIAADPKVQRASANLIQMKNALDTQIEAAAPGFQQYLANYANASRPIDAMQVLQKFENGLYDAQGRMTYQKVQTMMKNIVDRRSAPGINPYKSIPDDTMQQLWNLRDDLRRSASAAELARTPGSDTTQTMLDVMAGAGRAGANLAAQGVANWIAPGTGYFAVNAAKAALGAKLGSRAARREVQRGHNMLHPPPPASNPLSTP